MARLVLMRWSAVFIAALMAVACGGESPTGANGGGVVVQGVVLGDGASVSAADTRAPQAAQAKKVTVKVEGSTLSVDVNANGTFQLTGIPSGTFTLVFLADGVEVGRVVVTAGDGSEVKIVVQVTAGQLIVVEIKIEDGSECESAAYELELLRQRRHGRPAHRARRQRRVRLVRLVRHERERPLRPPDQGERRVRELQVHRRRQDAERRGVQGVREEPARRSTSAAR